MMQDLVPYDKTLLKTRRNTHLLVTVVKSSNPNCYEFWSFPIFNFFAYLLKYIFLSLDNQKVRERCAEYESAEITARKVNGKEKRRISDKKGFNKIQIIKFSGMNKENYIS